MDVKIIKEDGLSSVVETVLDGMLIRRIIPTHQVIDGVASTETLEAGIDYGLPFAEIIHPSQDFQTRIEVALHNIDVWTLDDLYKKSSAVRAALQAVYGIEVSQIIQSADQYLKLEQEKVAALPKTKKEKK